MTSPATHSDPVRAILEFVLRYPVLSPDQERAVLASACSGDSAAKELLVLSNLRYAYKLARNWCTRNPRVEIADAFQDAVLGLMEAAENFDESQGARFLTLATFLIRRQLIHARQTATVVRCPRHSVDCNAETRAKAKAACGVGSLTDPEPLVREDQLADPSAPDPLEVAARGDAARRVDEWLRVLPARHASVLRMRHGLDGDAPRTLGSVGERLGVNRERVRQIEKAAEDKIRERFLAEWQRCG